MAMLRPAADVELPDCHAARGQGHLLSACCSSGIHMPAADCACETQHCCQVKGLHQQTPPICQLNWLSAPVE